jgi:hypothetical protein
MTDEWESLLTAAVPPGIYRLPSSSPVDGLAGAARRAGWRVYVLNGEHIHDKATFLNAIARAMDFPSYFGKNWDALNDCLTDLEGTEPAGYVLLFQEPGLFIVTSPSDWGVATKVLETAIQFWNQLGKPFYVLLQGNFDLDVPSL